MSGIMPDESNDFMGKAEAKEMFGVDNTNALMASARPSGRSVRVSNNGRPQSNRVPGTAERRGTGQSDKVGNLMSNRDAYDEL